jgi:ABC-2 type transport system permease protein
VGKIGLIIRREYLSRVKKKSFIILTLLGPILWAGVILVPAFLNEAADSDKQIYVVDETHLGLSEIFKSSAKVKFHAELQDMPINRVTSMFKDSDNIYVLYLNAKIYDTKKVNIFCRKQPGINIMSYISTTLSSELQKDLLKTNNMDKALVDKYIMPVNVVAIENGKKITDTDKVATIGIVLGIFIYMFIFLYSAQVMRGVIEEKSSRVIEVIISSVKPFQLMMGKILGIALVGLTQFLLWVLLSIAVITPISSNILAEKHYKEISKPEMQIGIPLGAAHQGETIEQKKSESGETKASQIQDFMNMQDWPMILSCFLFYFLVGYLSYAAMFAAVGSAVDSETDTQQFMLPVSAPLILSIAMSGTIISNPDGPIAFWFSIIPLTSPIVMMMRLPFHPPIWEIALSMTLLFGFFILMTWLAGRIYRTGILMYGKKTSWKEIGKWLFYKE